MVQVKTDMTGWVMAEHGVPDSRWTVVERAEDVISPNGTIQAAYKCRCNCERKTVQVVRATSLKHGYSKSCGCINSERLQSEEHKKNTSDKCKNKTGMVRSKNNLIGKRFGMLTVKQQIEDYISPNGTRWAQYECECDCGNFVNVKGTDLTRKETADHKPKTHCGCQTHENMSAAQRKYNQYEFIDNYVVGVTNNTGSKFYFDAEDYDLVKDFCWFEHIDNTNYHSLMAKVPGTDKHIKMSHLIGFKGGDHINRNPLDNRKANLRSVSDSENMCNRSLFSNNKSGITGVYWDKSKNGWVANIRFNNEKIYLGIFTNKEDAIRTRLNAEVQYMGSVAPQIHLYEQYGIRQQND